MGMLFTSLFMTFIAVPTTIWMGLALYYRFRRHWLGMAVALLPLVTILIGYRQLPLFWTVLLWFALFGAMLIWWFSLRPSQEGDWDNGMAVLPRTQIDGDRISIENFRSFDYDATGQPIPRYEEKTFELSKLCSLDYFLASISGPLVVHTMVSFGFEDGQFLTVSVEARRQRRQVYSPLQGLFRTYALMYVLGDERDIIRLRTNVHQESVYMYRLRLKQDHIKSLLLDYLERSVSLLNKPEWYNSLTSNCTTNLFYHHQREVRWSLRLGIYINGLSARTLYRLGALGGDLPFRKLRAQSDILQLALAAGNASDFSQRIRARVMLLEEWHKTEG